VTTHPAELNSLQSVNGNWTTRGLPTRELVSLQTGQLAD